MTKDLFNSETTPIVTKKQNQRKTTEKYKITGMKLYFNVEEEEEEN